MAYLDYNSLGRYSVTFYVAGLNTTTTYRSIYITCNGRTSPNLAKSFASSTSNGWSVTGLNCGTGYSASWNITSSGGSTANGFGAITTSACPVVTPSPSAPPYVSATPSTSTSGRIYVSWGAASYADYYTCTIRRNGAYVTSQSVYGTSTEFGGLGEGITYEVIVVAYNSSGTSPQTSTYVTTHNFTPPPPSGISGLRVDPYTDLPMGRVRASWNSAYGASDYRYEIYDYYGNYTGINGSTSYTYITVTGLAQHTTYQFKVYARNAGGNGTPAYSYFTTHDFRPPVPGGISYVSAVASTTTSGRLSVAWAASSYAAGYKIEIYRSNGTLAQSQVNVGSATREYAFSGLSEYTDYYVKVYGYNERGNGTPAFSPTVKTSDLTPPYLFNLRGDGNGRAYVSWSATDSGSGLRSTSTYYVQISSPNGNTYGNGEYTTSQFKTFTSDAGGNSLQNNAWYYLRVSAYDNARNSSTETTQIQYKMARPTNWTWHSVKSSGSNINLTAAEWNSFCTRINQFRIYKNLANYNFTTVVTGRDILASQVNEARTAIQQMVPPTATPSAAIAGMNMMASFINGLSTSLNSIT